jgi:hypothetical protein
MIHYGSIGVGGLDGWRWGCLDNGVDRILAKIDEPETFVHFEFVGGSLDGGSIGTILFDGTCHLPQSIDNLAFNLPNLWGQTRMALSQSVIGRAWMSA